jgi:23S rRNA (uracil-5-)-methyltransferase RumA
MHSGGRCEGELPPTEADRPPRRVYAHGVLPGEIARVSLQGRRLGFRCGALQTLLEASPQRVQPFCPHAAYCGGCPWQHMAYPAQLYWKRQILADALAKYEISVPLLPEVIPSPLLQGYRNKAEYAYSALRWYPDSTVREEPCFGFHPVEESRHVFSCESCFLQAPQSHALAQKAFGLALRLELPLYHYPSRSGLLRSLQIRNTRQGEWLCIFGFNIAAEEVLSTQQTLILDFLQQYQALAPEMSACCYTVSYAEAARRDFYPVHQHFCGSSHIEEQIDDLAFRLRPESFFQPNTLQATALYQKTREWAGLSGQETVYDLYTGIGSIACYLAAEARHITGIEGNPQAVVDAQENARRLGLLQAQFIQGDILETFTPSFVDSHPRADLIVLDPPRAGTLTEIKKALLYAAPSKIIYVSCNPVSLAWDLKQLIAGGYRLSRIQAFDMFPHTQHVETVCLLTSSNRPS